MQLWTLKEARTEGEEEAHSVKPAVLARGPKFAPLAPT